VPPGSGLQGVLALPVEPDTAIRSGPEPWLIRLDDAASSWDYAIATEPGDVVALTVKGP